MMSLEFELVLPCYNEAKSLHHLVQRAIDAAKGNGFTADSFRLVVVNNGSTDDTNSILQNLSENPALKPWFRVVQVHPNQGYGHGLWEGLRSTQATYVGWSHADLQCDPMDAFRAYMLAKDQPNMLVKGHRKGRKFRDRFVSEVFRMFARVLLGLKVAEINAQPKVFSRKLLNQADSPPKTFAFDVYILFCAQKAGYQFQSIEVLFPPRIHGASKWAATMLGRHRTILGVIKYMWELGSKQGRLKAFG